jgi:hypothetical protein
MMSNQQSLSDGHAVEPTRARLIACGKFSAGLIANFNFGTATFLELQLQNDGLNC